MIVMEFKTTRQKSSGEPLPPEGDGWTLAGAANVPYASMPTEVFMYWQRESRPATRECGNCRAIAFAADGRCVGCGYQGGGPG